MSGKFGIAFLLVCTLFLQAAAYNPAESSMVVNQAGQNVTVLNNTVSSPCSVDQHFYVSGGVTRPDANFGVGVTKPGIDAGFQVAVCKGVSVPNPVTPGGK